MLITKTKTILITIRSQPYAFSVDGSSGELVAAGGTETETQVMIVMTIKMTIRTRTMMKAKTLLIATMLMMIRTLSQDWMRSIRTRLWTSHPQVEMLSEHIIYRMSSNIQIFKMLTSLLPSWKEKVTGWLS